MTEGRYARDATYYRTALLLGLTKGEDVVRWAERAIADVSDPPGAFYDVVSVSAADLTGLRNALWPLVIDPEPVEVLAKLIGVLHVDLITGVRTLEDTLTIVRQMRSMLRLPSDVYAGLNEMLVTFAETHERAVVIGWLQNAANPAR